MALLLQPAQIANGFTAYDRTGKLKPLRVPLLRLRLGKERGDHQVSEEPHRVDLIPRVAPQVMPLRSENLLARLPDATAQFRHLHHGAPAPA